MSAPPTGSPVAPPASLDRRLDLDWLRIGAFGLLILYHVGMFYVTWDFHVKSSRASDAIEPLMLLSNPWRLLLLFIISGAASRFMLDKMPASTFAGSRMWRLLPPLVFGMLVIVPPQTWLEIVQKLDYTGSFADFYGLYIQPGVHWRIDGEPLVTPTWNHLWFVVYIAVYSLVLIPAATLVRHIPRALAAPLLWPPALLVAPILLIFALRITLFDIFGDTHALVDDWHNHALYFSGFLAGYAIAKNAAFFAAAERLRWIALGLGVAAWLFWQAGDDYLEARLGEEWAALVVRLLRSTLAWAVILALFGFGSRHLRGHDGPVRRYLTDAIFPFYIIHQTVIIAAGAYLDPLQWPLWIEAPVLIATTAAACFLGYEIVRRMAVLRPLFGLKSQPRSARPVGAAAT